MTERKRRMRTTNKTRLEAAGFEFEQIPEGERDAGRWRVWLPVKSPTFKTRVTLPKVYKHLTTAVSAGVRQIERARVRKNAYGDIGKDWETVLKKFDEYKPDFKDIW